MAERRMMSKSIIKSDTFLDMPSTTQNLYFHMLLDADDDGFINAPKSIMRMIGAKDDDMKVLVAKQFVIPFESGVVVIKDWKIHNYIQNDRYKPSTLPERDLINIQKDKTYTLKNNVSILDTECIQSVSIGKDRLGKDRLGKDRLGETTTTETKKIKAIAEDVAVVDEELSKIAKLYLENGFGQASGYTAELLKQALQEYSFAWCQKALQLTVEQGGKSWRYTRAILENWKSKYDKTAKPWEVENERHKKGNRKDETEPTDWSSMPTDRW